MGDFRDRSPRLRKGSFQLLGVGKINLMPPGHAKLPEDLQGRHQDFLTRLDRLDYRQPETLERGGKQHTVGAAK